MPSEGKKCPKCGGEMNGLMVPEGWMAYPPTKPDKYQCPNCGHEEKVK